LPSPTDPHTLALHDALPISGRARDVARQRNVGARAAVVDAANDRPSVVARERRAFALLVVAARARDARDAFELHAAVGFEAEHADRKSTRLNSSHQIISYAV